MINVLKAIKTIKKIEQLQKTMHDSSVAFLLMQDIGLMPESEKGRAKAKAMHDVSHMIKDVLDGKSVDEATERLSIKIETKEETKENEQKRLNWYRKNDIKKYLKEIAKLWRKYEDRLDGRIV